MVHEKRHALVFLCETKLEVSRLESMKRQLGFSSCVGVNPVERGWLGSFVEKSK